MVVLWCTDVTPPLFRREQGKKEEQEKTKQHKSTDRSTRGSQRARTPATEEKTLERSGIADHRG